MKRLSPALPLLLAAFFCAAPPLPADAAPPTAKRHESRFLFIVDTSAAMRGCSNASVQGVIDLLASDMKGELRKGDTIGLWTYNEQLSTEYPMQVWSTEDKSAIMDEMAAYLRGRRYGKRAHLENVMPALGQVIKNSERLAVILISDGSGLIQGTPYDREINLLQKKYARDLRSAHQPFVTVLAVRDGVVFDYIINYPGWVAIPHIPTPPPAETNAPILAASPSPPTNAPPVRRPMRSFIMSASTNAPHAAAPPPVPAAAQPPPTVVAAPVPVPAPVVATPVPSPSYKAAAPFPVPPHVAVVAPAPASQPAPPPIVARQNPEPAAAASPPHAPAPVNEQQLPPAPAAARNAPVAAIAPPGGAPLALYVMAFSLLTIAVVLVVFLIRRLRKAPQASLISQSIDRPR
jgi:hypothetical protein